MDKNQFIGFALILAIIVGWSLMTAPSKEELERQKHLKDSIAQARLALEEGPVSSELDVSAIESDPDISDSLRMNQLTESYGDFASSSVGDEESFNLSNNLISINFSNKGGFIKEAILKEHKKILQDKDYNETKVDLKLLEDDRNKLEYIIPVNGKSISSADLFYEAKQSGNKLSFKANAGSGYVEHVYELLPDSYKLDYHFNIVGLQNSIDRSTDVITMNWVNYLDKLEINETFEKFYTTTYYKEIDESSDYCSCRGDDEEVLEDRSIKWVSGVNQFFNSSIIAKDQAFEGAEFKIKMMDENAKDLKKLESTLGIPYGHSANESFAMQMYIGPNDYPRLKAIGIDLEEIIPYGRSVFGTINRYIIRPFFNWLAQFFSAKGVVIIVLIFIIKMLLYPFNYKMLHSQAKMGALKPDIAKMTVKFKDDPQKKQVETMKLYREYGVSPLGGCLPMIAQMPIFYALFRFFPADITFRQVPFLWASDLSSYDVFMRLPFEIPMAGSHISLFTILWAITQVIYTYYNTKHMDMSANPAMKYVQYFMPIMFLVFFNNYASGLTCYMFFSTLFTILQTVITKKFVFNEEKIRAELMKEKAKPKKKSGFSARLEEAMKQQQQVAANQKKKKKK